MGRNNFGNSAPPPHASWACWVSPQPSKVYHSLTLNTPRCSRLLLLRHSCCLCSKFRLSGGTVLPAFFTCHLSSYSCGSQAVVRKTTHNPPPHSPISDDLTVAAPLPPKAWHVHHAKQARGGAIRRQGKDAMLVLLLQGGAFPPPHPHPQLPQCRKPWNETSSSQARLVCVRQWLTGCYTAQRSSCALHFYSAKLLCMLLSYPSLVRHPNPSAYA